MKEGFPLLECAIDTMIVSVFADPDRLNENIPFCGVTSMRFTEWAMWNHENHERKGFNSF
jgi:hypothetical protein